MQELQSEAVSLVIRFAEWSLKYPRGGIYSMNSKMDNELIALEDEARDLKVRMEAYSKEVFHV